MLKNIEDWATVEHKLSLAANILSLFIDMDKVQRSWRRCQ